MEWISCIKGAIDYMEEHLTEIQSPDEVARHVHISPLYLQHGFRVMTGYTIGEYIRNRRLSGAAAELVRGNERVIDIAYKYGYETPESFAKAFSRFHGHTPSEVRRDRSLAKSFRPLTISIVIQGGEKMNYCVEKMDSLKVIGISREFAFDNAYDRIPDFWNEVYGKYQSRLFFGKEPENETEKAVYFNRVGEFGICIDDAGGGSFRYMIAGRYMGGGVPAGFELYELPAGEWAKFKCIGPMPEAMQSVNTQIWNEWLPGNVEYELAGKYNIEWYSSAANMQDAAYHSEIWIPVKRKYL